MPRKKRSPFPTPWRAGERVHAEGYALNRQMRRLVRSAIVEFLNPPTPEKRFALVDREGDLGLGDSATLEPLLVKCLDLNAALLPAERRMMRSLAWREGGVLACQDPVKHYFNRSLAHA